MSASPKPGYCALRRGRVDVAGQIYALTTVTAGRRPIFADFWKARMVIRSISDIEAEGHAETLAFVVMPDHLHWLIALQSPSVSGVVRLLKSRSARKVNLHLGTRESLWQSGFHDHAARRDESVVAMARYIVANPLRAGLAEVIGDYPHWDCKWI